MYKIISILFVITLINAQAPVAPVAPVVAAAEYTTASAKVMKDEATGALATANTAKTTAVDAVAVSQGLQTTAHTAQVAALAAYTLAVETLGLENQKNLAAMALAGAAKAKYAGLLATTNTANAANELNKANVIAAAARKVDMTISQDITTSHGTQTKALEDAVEVVGDTGLVGLSALNTVGYNAAKTYIDKQVTDAATLVTSLTTEAQGTQQLFDAAKTANAMGATNGGTKCTAAKALTLSTPVANNYAKQVALQTQTALKTTMTAVQSKWVTEMGSGNTNKLAIVEAAVTKVKEDLALYKTAIAAQEKVVTDQQSVVDALITFYEIDGKVGKLQTAYDTAKGLSDADHTLDTNAATAAVTALDAYNTAVLSVTTTRGTRDTANTAAMAAMGALAALQVTEAAAVGQVNYETANLALANEVVAEVAARATMRDNLVSAATTAATAAASAAETAVTAAAEAAAAAVTAATNELATDTAAAVAKAKVDTHKLDLVQMTKWNESYALDALIAKKICDAAIADASKKTL